MRPEAGITSNRRRISGSGFIIEGRRKREEGRRKREEGRGKKEEGRRTPPCPPLGGKFRKKSPPLGGKVRNQEERDGGDGLDINSSLHRNY
ncbi:MAG: hypothetical protein EAZ78_12420 [Oscillatoriales cyanobacterium]|nr:MAG: hypothetical protein EAZ98_16515 [Oscillatoriales cyanobacterium]TAE02889.1 MAG: hypothetical protein EAZ96_14655 [Oscillatoriales cyanobacterium]TAF03499.1 MAG: hypothetical protein EAZ78_12420 [Oscillatoriales cyanobacterium]TAF46788.1 MAG: hypothetical protein EAZ68_03290 [Oscillatoriales cyanobacterium]TAF70776.1 MAG: hypothetical protein EAZ59_03305 [Oscillatoriales cyanobacterium]